MPSSSDQTSEKTPDYQQLAYILISLVLVIPLLLWPLLWQIGGSSGLSLNFGENIQRNLSMAASSLLIAAVVADSVLTRIASYKQLLCHTLWVLAAAAAASLAIKMAGGTYLLAIIFALHSLRAAIPLWTHHAQWWHKTAWVRDTLTSGSLFYWFSHWPL